MKLHFLTFNGRHFSDLCRKLSVSFLISGTTLGCIAQPTPPKALLALSKADHVLAIVDPVSFKVLARVPVGTDPHEVIASSDGKTAFVSIYGGGSLHELDIIDLVNQKALPAVDTKPFFGPHGLDFAQGKVYMTAEGSKSIVRFDPATGKFDWAMGTGQDRTHMIYVNPDGKKIFTTNVSSGTVSILQDTLVKFGGPPPGAAPGGGPPPGAGGPPPGGGGGPGGPPQPRHDWIQTVIAVGHGSEGFDVSPDGKQLWTAAADDGMIYVIDVASKTLSAKIDAKAMGANRLKFTPDGKKVLISSLGTGNVYVYDAVSQQLVKTISTGHGAAGILMDPDGSQAFIGCSGDGYVAVIDLNKLEVTGHINVGGVPDGLAWAVRQ
jgi:DNA-binding beta-propeller fold protein YncE